MSISITDPPPPPANQNVGSSFTVSGTFYCPVGGPTFTCSISPTTTSKRESPGPAKIQSLYLTNAQATWGAYFSGVAAGDYTISASIMHTGSQINAAPVNITVGATPPPVTITSPTEGATFPVGTIAVSGTVSSGYLSGYNVSCSLTGAGFVATGSPVTATPDQYGNWSVTLPVPQGVSGYNRMNVNANLIDTVNNNAVVYEMAVGSLTVQ
jgi:hypothetical protein